MKIIIAGVAAIAVAGGVALAVKPGINGNKTEHGSQQIPQELIVQENPDSLANASLVVYSNYGTQLSEYDVTLKNESEDGLAYHVDDAGDDYPYPTSGWRTAYTT